MNEYERADRIIYELLLVIAKKFKKTARKLAASASSLAAFDEINLLFEEADDLATDAYLLIAQDGYGQISGRKRRNEFDIDFILWLDGIYDPTCEYVYSNEYERKKERLKESVMAVIEKSKKTAQPLAVKQQRTQGSEFPVIVTEITKERSTKLSFEGEAFAESESYEEATQPRVTINADIERLFDKAYNQVALMMQQHAIMVLDEGRKDAMQDENINKVKWVASMDERTCEECMALDGSVFRINDVPAKHYRCRCILVPVK